MTAVRLHHSTEHGLRPTRRVLRGVIAIAAAVLAFGPTQLAQAAPTADAAGNEVTTVVLGGYSANHMVIDPGARVIGAMIPGDVEHILLDVVNAGPGEARLTVEVVDLDVPSGVTEAHLDATSVGGVSLAQILAGQNRVITGTVPAQASQYLAIPVAMDVATTAGRPGQEPAPTIDFNLLVTLVGEASPDPSPTPSPSPKPGQLPNSDLDSDQPQTPQDGAMPSTASRIATTGSSSQLLGWVSAAALALGILVLLLVRRRHQREPANTSS